MYQNSFDLQDYLQMCWCEINGGGAVTPDQLEAIRKIEEDKKQFRRDDTQTDKT